MHRFVYLFDLSAADENILSEFTRPSYVRVSQYYTSHETLRLMLFIMMCCGEKVPILVFHSSQINS